MSFAHKFHRLRHVSAVYIPAIVYSKFRRKALSIIERLQYRSDGARRLGQFRPRVTVRPLGLIHKDAWLPDFVTRFPTTYAADAAELIRQADQAEKLIFDLLGSGPANLKWMGKGLLNWHVDFKSGHQWNPRTFYADITYGDVPGADIKVPWELSRGQHFVTLGQAYRLTSDERYARAFFAQVNDWIQQNPVKYGVNWASPMDVALRACNWLLAWDFFKDSSSRPDGFEGKFGASLQEHGEHVFSHLEWGADVSTNHYISNLVGLAYLGVALNNRTWLEFARKEMFKEIDRQTYSDGFGHEGSTAYHKFVLEMFFYFSVLVVRNSSAAEIELEEGFTHRLMLMFQSIQSLGFNGHVPLIGDNDSGHVHVLCRRADNDFSYLLNLGSAFFKNQDLKVHEWPVGSEIVWLCGWSGVKEFNLSDGVAQAELPSKAPMGSGVVTIRGRQDLLVFVAQPNGTRGVGNHTHNDKLSFTLTIAGDRFFEDPGSGVYTSDPALRNELRSTRQHTTLSVDDQEQNRFDARDLFVLKDDAHVHVQRWAQGREIQASHNGYSRLDEPVLHIRHIKREEDPLSWTVTDDLKGSGRHNLGWTFVLGPEIRVKMKTANVVLLTGQFGQLTVESRMPDLTFDVANGPFSPAYGVVKETTVLRVAVTAFVPFSTSFHFVWRPLNDRG